MAYNFAFFGLFENIFLYFHQKYGEEKALEYFSDLMHLGLMNSYGDDFEKGIPKVFSELVAKRDLYVGLNVEFSEVSANKIIYRFLEDPFPKLKGKLSSKLLDATYMNFKINHLLGEGWTYKTTKHIWNGDSFTEHVIYKVHN